jgi:hypothetical protein
MRKAGINGLPVLTVILLLTAGVCASVSGCRAKPSWTAEARSPDGKMIAKARTFENGGFGTDFVETTVDLNFTKGKQSPMEILAFSDGPAGPGGMTVGMNWLSPTHLELTYKGQGSPDFQAVRYYGVEITLRSLAGQAASASKP